MTLLTLAILAIAGLIHWYAVKPNRRTDGRFARKTRLERYGVYVLLVAACALVLGGCGAVPKRITTGGTVATLRETEQVAVPPSYPPPQPRREVKYQSSAPLPSWPPNLSIPAPATQPAQTGVYYRETDYYPPAAAQPPTVLNRRTETIATTQASTSVDIVTPRSWGGYWIGLCLLIAAGCAVAATITPIKRLYVVAGAAAALASLALVPPAYLGVALLLTVIVLLGGVAWFAYRSGVWRQATTEVCRGVEKVKEVLDEDTDTINTILKAEQTTTAKEIRTARGK